jgi:hypothetical protein
MWNIAVVLGALGVSAAGCIPISQVHAAGPFVKSIRAQPGGLAIERCAVVHVHETAVDCLTPILSILLLSPIANQSSTRTFLEERGCSSSVVATGEVP